jgi:hypothetical protein
MGSSSLLANSETRRKKREDHALCSAVPGVVRLHQAASSPTNKRLRIKRRCENSDEHRRDGGEHSHEAHGTESVDVLDADHHHQSKGCENNRPVDTQVCQKRWRTRNHGPCKKRSRLYVSQGVCVCVCVCVCVTRACTGLRWGERCE